MAIYEGKQGTYNLENSPLAKGGEGAVYKVNGNSNVVAKIYYNPTKELEKKLVYMSGHIKDKSILKYVCWPIDLLYDENNYFCGVVMPKMEADTELVELYKFNPNSKPILTYQNRIIIAINICKLVSLIHKENYIIGDFNPSNIGINLANGIVNFFDTDSYHVYNSETNEMYRCGVCLNGYVAPELIQQCKKGTSYLDAPLPTFTQETDRFALAIHIFKLLMNGFTPFNGIEEHETISKGSPGIGNQAIERDNYCFKLGNKPKSLATPSLSSFPTSIQDLFTRAFIEGKRDPKRRPTADEWERVLANYLKNEIKVCSKDKNHHYYKKAVSCPYCEAKNRYLGNLKQTQIDFSQQIDIQKEENNILPSIVTIDELTCEDGGDFKNIPNINATNVSEPHMALLFLVDTSSSMSGQLINETNNALNRFKKQVCQNPKTKDILDVSIIKFDSKYEVVQEFVPVEYMEKVNFTANGPAYMTHALDKSIELVKERLRLYRRCGTESYKPWIVFVSSGNAIKNADELSSIIKNNNIAFWSFATSGANYEVLHKLSGMKVLNLENYNFDGFFDWTNKSMYDALIEKDENSLPGFVTIDDLM